MKRILVILLLLHSLLAYSELPSSVYQTYIPNQKEYRFDCLTVSGDKAIEISGPSLESSYILHSYEINLYIDNIYLCVYPSVYREMTNYFSSAFYLGYKLKKGAYTLNINAGYRLFYIRQREDYYKINFSITF